MNLEKLKSRNSTLDLIRVIAIISVIGVHFFLNTDFYNVPLEGMAMFGVTAVRVLMNICVPLFIILTGYLMSQKTLSVGYYKGIRRTLLIYVVASIACILFKYFYYGSPYTFWSGLLSILDFSGADYSWYIEMYIGLFLFAPFLNLAYNGLKSQKQKQVLLLTIIGLTILPSLFNVYNFQIEGWWANPSLSSDYQALVPDYWMTCYSFAYYFVGCYFREYGMKIKTKTAIATLGVFLFASTLFIFYRCYGVGYASSYYGYWYGFIPFGISTLTFIILSRIKIKENSINLRWCLWKLSDMALGVYLLSYIFDVIFYKQLKSLELSYPLLIIAFPVMLVVVYAASNFASCIVNYLVDFILIGYKKTVAFVKKQIQLNRKMFWQDVLFTTLLVGGIVFSIWKAHYGFGGNDEAFYLTVPQRLLDGDSFIVDEWHLSQLSGFLLLPFVWAYETFVGSTVGIIFAARILYVIIHAAVASLVYFKIRKYGVLSVVGCILFFLFTPFNIMAYSYNTMGLDLVVIAGIMLGTTKFKNPIPVIISGLAFAGAVLCCPYLAVAYVVFGICVLTHYVLKKFNFNCVINSQMFSVKTFGFFTVGISALAILFLTFALSRSSLSEILNSLPLLFTDPEHPTTPILIKLGAYFKAIYNHHSMVKYWLVLWVPIIVALLVDEKMKKHRSIYLICSTVLALFYYAFIGTNLYNAIMFPIIFVGIVAYILCDNKPRNLMASLVALSIIYSVCIHFSSNQLFYIIPVALSAANIACFVFIGQVLKEMKQNPDNLDYAVFLKHTTCWLTVLMVLVQAGIVINIKSTHCFWETYEPSELTTKITEGPAKGIYTSKSNAEEYSKIYYDMSFYQGKEGKILCLSNRTWCYLATDSLEYATFSAWNPEDYSTVERLEAYYESNPDKKPDYIYIPVESKWDFTDIAEIAEENGYTWFKNAVGYKLEKK